MHVYVFLIYLALCQPLLNKEAGSDKSPRPSPEPRMKGVCWVAGDSISKHNLDPLIESGITWISQTPFGWMNGHDDPNVRLKTTRVLWGETDRGITHTTCLARESGIRSMLKPHIWIRNSKGKWRSDIAMENEEQWDQWFESYEHFIIHYAKLAESLGIESLCIGTELRETIRQHPEKWRDIIHNIRQVYKGQLTYAANWYKEYEEVSFWDELDYIGIQGYFPLSKRPSPSKDELLKSWKSHKKRINRISKKYQKPVIFTEIGYRNTSDAAIDPWTWPQTLEKTSFNLSEETQRKCYEAMFESLWDEPWFSGIFIWKWFHSTYRYEDLETYFVERQKRRMNRPNYRRRADRKVFFSPQQQPALRVMNEWYLKR